MKIIAHVNLLLWRLCPLLLLESVLLDWDIESWGDVFIEGVGGVGSGSNPGMW